LRLPYTVELGATGLGLCYLRVPSKEFSSGQLAGPIMKESIAKRYLIYDIKHDTLMNVLRSYFTDFYDLAACSRDDVLTNYIVVANNLPSRRIS
jgi:hypothetical protein